MTVRVVLVFALVIHLSRFAKVEGGIKNSSLKEDFDIEKEAQLLNKHALKTIKTENGDIYDCIDFYKQPAFDNPLLKNHTYHFQMKPNFPYSKKMTKKEVSTVKQDIGISLMDKGCPIGTVPIRRSSEEDVIRAKIFEKGYDSESRFSTLKDDQNVQQYFALARTKSRLKAKYHGAGAYLSIYNPKVDALAHEYSAARITLRNGRELIQFGWMVNPGLYKDTRTRLFTRFVGKSGSCFDTLCPGFIIVNTEIILGGYLDKITRRGHLPIYEIYLFIQQDGSGNWWLQAGSDPDNATEIGFWPQRLFSRSGLMEYATYADWGGSAFGTIPEMGSGHLPKEDTKYDAYFAMVNVLNGARKFVDTNVEVFSNFENYKLVDIGRHRDFGHVVTFGGPYS